MQNKRFLNGVLAAFFIILVAGVLKANAVITRHCRECMEASLRADLIRFDEAVGRFYDDCGAYPAHLEDITASASNPPKVGAGGKAIPEGAYQGPYMESIPVSPLGPYRDFPGSMVQAEQVLQPENWGYNPSEGRASAISNELSLSNDWYCSW